MKKRFLILVTCITLFAVIADSYKSFFVKNECIELADEEQNEKDPNKSLEKDSEKDVKDKHTAFVFSIGIYSTQKNNLYIKESNILPAPYSSLLEMPPELV